MRQIDAPWRISILELIKPLRLPPEQEAGAASSVERSLVRYRSSMSEPRAGYEFVYVEGCETAKGINFLDRPVRLEIERQQLKDELLAAIEALEISYSTCPALFDRLSEQTQQRFDMAISIITDEMAAELMVAEAPSEGRASRERMDRRQKRLIRDLAFTWRLYGGEIQGGAENGIGGPFIRYLQGAAALVGITTGVETVRSWMRFQVRAS